MVKSHEVANNVLFLVDFQVPRSLRQNRKASRRQAWQDGRHPRGSFRECAKPSMEFLTGAKVLGLAAATGRLLRLGLLHPKPSAATLSIRSFLSSSSRQSSTIVAFDATQIPKLCRPVRSKDAAPLVAFRLTTYHSPPYKFPNGKELFKNEESCEQPCLMPWPSMRPSRPLASMNCGKSDRRT